VCVCVCMCVGFVLPPTPTPTPPHPTRSPDWSRHDLIQFEKKFYFEHPRITSMSESEVQQIRADKKLTVEGGGVPRPVTKFEDCNFPDYLMAEIGRSGFKEPSPIQCQGWPMALSGRDMIGIAETGSGKTLAFLLPGIVHINAQPLLRPGDGPIVLILCPTRELACQIQEQVARFGGSSKLKHTCLYGSFEDAFMRAVVVFGAHECERVPCPVSRFLRPFDDLMT
jgi:ATP-dependent RNA helicase DDX5/DBP2